MAAACVQEVEDTESGNTESAKYISSEDLQQQLQLSGSEALTVQVDNGTGYIIQCGKPLEVCDGNSQIIVTESGDSNAFAHSNQQIGTSLTRLGIDGDADGSGSSNTNICERTSENENQDGGLTDDKHSEGSLIADKTNSLLKDLEPEEQKDTKSSVEIAIQANDYDIERRSGKVPARRRVIPFKFRDYKNPDLLNEERSDSDSDYNPDFIDEAPVKKKRMVARKSTTQTKRGRPRKSPKDMVILIQSADSSSQIVPYDELNESVQNSISTAIANHNVQEALPDETNVKQEDVQTDSGSETGEIKTNLRTRKRESKDFECEQCQKIFSSKGNLKTHEKTHLDEKPFKCDFNGCGKAFRSNESLRRHRLSHMGIKPFECSICKNKFASNVSLQEHLSRHTREKPHQCHICHKYFRQVSCLRRHLFTHSTELPFSCPICGRKFSQNVYLRSHMKVHTGERPFKCTECGKAFAHQSDLTRHKIVHTGRKPYACEVCNAKFSDPSSKRRHEKEHVGSKPYVCQLCFESFKRGGQLKTHLSRKHTNQKDEIPVSSIQKDGIIQFVYKDGIPVSLHPENLDQVKDKKIVKLIKDLNSKMVQNVHIPTSQEGDMDSNIEDLAAIETVVMETSQQSSDSCITNSMSLDTTSQNIQIDNSNGTEETVITISEVEELQEVTGSEVPVEYLQIIEGVMPESTNQEVVILPYNQGEETPVELVTSESSNREVTTATENNQGTDNTSAIEDTQSVDYVMNPDFNCQQYYNWLSSFTELCKVMPMPLDLSLFQKINQVHKTLSDVMATPSGVVADRDNFKILMNISQELNGIINEHLFHVMQNLDTEK